MKYFPEGWESAYAQAYAWLEGFCLHIHLVDVVPRPDLLYWASAPILQLLVLVFGGSQTSPLLDNCCRPRRPPPLAWRCLGRMLLPPPEEPAPKDWFYPCRAFSWYHPCSRAPCGVRFERPNLCLDSSPALSCYLLVLETSPESTPLKNPCITLQSQRT